MTNNSTGLTNETLFLQACLTPQLMDFNTFVTCYGALARASIMSPLLELFLVAFGSFFMNLLVIIMILMKPMTLSTFDKIMIGHALVDGLTGLIDIPIFHVNNFFGYWPLPSFFCYFWSSYDNNINTTTSMHMLFMTYVRLRSIQAPKNYKNEYVIKNPIKIMIGIWAFGLGFWTPIVIHFGISEYSCDPNLAPFYLTSILNFFLWFTPLFAILVLSIQILYILHARSKIPRSTGVKASRYEPSHINGTYNNSRTYLSNTNTFSSSLINFRQALKLRLEKYRMGAQGKFFIIVSFFFIKFRPPSWSLLPNFGIT